nr:TonB family protein [uncultured Sphingomonas sp.]
MSILLAMILLGADDPSPPKPKVSPGQWVTNDDYPTAAIRAGQSGVVGFTLKVDASGKVTDCVVDSSSGSSLLDSTTCTLLRARVAFAPARDEKGHAVAGSFSSRFRWELPRANQPIPWSADQDTKIELDVSYGADGALTGCKGTASKTVTSTSEELCAQVSRSAPIRSIDGKPVPYHQVTTITTRYRHD